jgi:L-fuconolactonase
VFRSLGERPNIVLKFSGLSHPQRAFTRENAQGLFDLSLEAFGARRIMIGSDWPLTQAFGGYQATWSTTNELLGQLGESERSSIRWGTAKQIYGASTRLANMTTKETG